MMEKIVAVRESTPPDFLTVEETAKVLRIGKAAVYRLVRSGGIPAVRYGKQFRIPRVAIEEQLGGPITWPPPTDESYVAAPVAPVTSPVARPRTTRRRQSRDDQSSFPFSA